MAADSPAAPVILAFDTAGSAASAAVARAGQIIARRHLPLRYGHAEALMPLIERVMREAALTASALELVAVTVGPGGFTGIRVGLAAARGIALACGALLLGVSGFEAVAASVPFEAPREEEPASLMVALESRREDLYIALFDPRGTPLVPPLSVKPEDLSATLGEAVLDAGVVVAGDAAERAAAALPQSSLIRVQPDRVPNAAGVARAAYCHWLQGTRENGARPLYLHPPDVTFPAPRRRGGQ
jgi:tRNA threonylcarbamoyladenosine biosynthesis protein TsaB